MSEYCRETIEHRGAGMRYAYSRHQCRRKVSDGHTYCWQHRVGAYMKSKCCDACRKEVADE